MALDAVEDRKTADAMIVPSCSLSRSNGWLSVNNHDQLIVGAIRASNTDLELESVSVLGSLVC